MTGAGEGAGAGAHLLKSDPAGVSQVRALSLEVRVGLVPDNKHDVGWDLVGRLVAFALEGDLGPGLPARLHVDGENLLLLLRSPVRRHHPPRDLHPLRHALQNSL